MRAALLCDEAHEGSLNMLVGNAGRAEHVIGGVPRARRTIGQTSRQYQEETPASTILTKESSGVASVEHGPLDAGSQSHTRSPLLPACICARSLALKSIARCGGSASVSLAPHPVGPPVGGHS